MKSLSSIKKGCGLVSFQNLKEVVPSRETSDYAIFPLVVYSPSPIDEVYLIPYHWHDEIEIIYIQQGDFILHINGVAYKTKVGDVYFINSQEIHQIASTTPTSSHHAIVFDPKIIRFEWHDSSSQKYITPLITGKIKYPTVIHCQDGSLGEIAKEITATAQAYENEKSSWPIVAKAALLKILTILIDNELMVNIELTEDKDNEKAVVAKTIMTYIHNNYMNKITLDELANLANLSTSYFCKFFKTVFDNTAVEFINEYRIEKACLLLTQTDDKIIDIAFSVGFDNFSYFIRKFKSSKGLSPAKYRKIITQERLV